MTTIFVNARLVELQVAGPFTFERAIFFACSSGRAVVTYRTPDGTGGALLPGEPGVEAVDGMHVDVAMPGDA